MITRFSTGNSAFFCIIVGVFTVCSVMADGGTVNGHRFGESPANVSTRVTQTAVPMTIQTVSSGAAALTVIPALGHTLIVTSADGGIFAPVTGASPGTYTSNGGGSCGTVMVPAGGEGSRAWVRFSSAPVDVRWFGADPMGTRDSTNQIQRALDTSPAVLFFPAGIYNLSSPVAMKNGTTLVGAGLHQSIIRKTTANTSIIVVANDNEIYGFQFSGVGTVMGGVLGREVIYGSPNAKDVYATNISVHDNYFDGTLSTSCVGGNNLIHWSIFRNVFALSNTGEHGIYLSTGSRDVRIFNNTLTKTISNGYGCNAINIKGSAHVYIHDNEITGAGWDGYGIVSSVVASKDLNFSRNHIHNLAPEAIPIRFGSNSADTNVVVMDNVIEGGYYGIQANAPNTLIAGNHISGTTYRGIECNSDTLMNQNTHLVVQDNVLSNCNGGIRVHTAFDGTYIRGNVCTGSTGIGIEYNNGSIVGSVSGNDVHGFTTAYSIRVPISCDICTKQTPSPNTSNRTQ